MHLGGSGVYNSIEYKPKHSHCTLKDEALERVIDEHSELGEFVIKSPISTVMEFFFPSAMDFGVPWVSLQKPCSYGKPWEVKSLELFDETIFQDVLVTGWEVTNPSRRAWSVADLEGAKIRFYIKFLSFDDINLKNPPRLHNLHMYFGHRCPLKPKFPGIALLSGLTLGLPYALLVLQRRIESTTDEGTGRRGRP